MTRPREGRPGNGQDKTGDECEVHTCQKLSALLRADDARSKNEREKDHDNTHREHHAKRTHHGEQCRCRPVIVPFNGAHDGIGVWRGEEGEPKANEDQAGNDDRKAGACAYEGEEDQANRC